MENREKIEAFLKEQGIKYVDLLSYQLPFLHSSYTHETPWDDEPYERLEFLGDAILGKAVSEYLYLNFPQYDQGDMTLMKHHVVNKEFLSMVGRELNFQELMSLGQGEDKNNLSDSVYEDVFESLVGAIYLDAGADEANKWLNKHILSKIDNLSVEDTKDPKTRLQEMYQAKERQSVQYETTNGERTEDNLMVFKSTVFFKEGNDKIILGVGEGTKKKDAEKAAAQDALERMA